MLDHDDEIALRASLDVVEEERSPDEGLPKLFENNEEFNLNLPEEENENGAGPEEIDYVEKEVVYEDHLDFDKKSDMREPLRP